MGKGSMHELVVEIHIKYIRAASCHHTCQNQNKMEYDIYYIAPSRNLARIVKSYTVEA
jgi:hypothetical protein